MKQELEKFLVDVSIAGAITIGLNWIIYCTRYPVIPERNPLGDVTSILEEAKYHGGVRELKEDRDFDNDGMNDHYFTCYDGTIYNDRSRNLLTGKDYSFLRHWYKIPPKK